MKMYSRYNDCDPVPEDLLTFANDRDYTLSDLQSDPELRRRLEAEMAEGKGA